MSQTLLLGAVAYDPKLVTIWDGFREYFAGRGLRFDYILYTSYERQVEAHFAGHIHVAWNSPLAWVNKVSRANSAVVPKQSACAIRIAIFTSVVIVRSDGPVQSIADLKGRRVGVGAKDSPQATLIPLHSIRQHGLQPGEAFEVVRFDRLVGKHGDHIGGERDAARALIRGECDAACLIEGNHLVFMQDGTLPSGATRVIARTPPYDHCN